jgi:hypothetical protein
MEQQTKTYLEKLIDAKTSFATVAEKKVFVWFTSYLMSNVDTGKSYRLAKALMLANRLTGLITVFMFYESEGVIGRASKTVWLNMWYGKTIKGLTYTCIHEACHVAVPGNMHAKAWVVEMKKYYPSEVITAGAAKNIPWPYGVNHAPTLRIIKLNEYMEAVDK